MKRIIATAVCLALIATMAISGSVAYLTDEEKAENIFAVGNVDIIQHEQERKDESSLQDFTNTTEKLRYPMVESQTETETTSEWIFDETQVNLRNPEYYANYVDKIVTVENKGDSPAYIRNIIAIPTGLPAGAEDVEWLEIDWFDMPGETSSEWEQAHIEKDVEIEGVLYDIYVFNYIEDDGVFASGDSTLPTLLGFGLSKYVDYDDENKTYYFQDFNNGGDPVNININPSEMKILVATQAVQTAGFADFSQAFGETFKDITKTNHPWYTGPVIPTDNVVIENGQQVKYSWDELIQKEMITVEANNSYGSILRKVDPAVVTLIVEDGVGLIASDIGTYYQNQEGKLKTLVVGEDVSKISTTAFQNISSLETVIFPTAKTITIDGNAFSGTGIKELMISKNINITTATSPFENCKALTTVTIANDVTSLHENLFRGCSSLTSVTMPETLKTFVEQNYAKIFYGCPDNLVITYV